MIKILKNPKTKNYDLAKQKILDPSFNWFYEPETNAGKMPIYKEFRDLPFYSHPVISRPIIEVPFPLPVSPEWKLFVEVFKEIMSYNNMTYKTIYRMNINSTFYVHDLMTPPHIDHNHPHNNIIVYLNSFSAGNTHVFHHKWPFPEDSITPKSLKYSFKGEEDDIIVFDGLHYHCMECPSVEERRIILVATYLT